MGYLYLTYIRYPSLEVVINFSPAALAFGHGYKKAIPKRRFRRRMALRGSVPGSRARGCTPTRVRPARGLQRTEVGGENRLAVALHAPRPSSVGGHLPADAAVDKSGSIRGYSPRFARALAAFGGQDIRPERGHPRCSHASLDPRERPSRGLRRTQGQEGLKSARRGGYFRPPSRPAR